MERVTLLQLRPEAFLSYTSGQELPANVKEALLRAVNLRSAANASQSAVTDAEKQRSGFVSEQDRIRKNLEAAGGQTQQGQEYMKRLISLDDSIDKIDAELKGLRDSAKAAQKAYEDYLGGLRL
jgi:predicted  nucleic acid-binding Zn-ribbon protein